MFQLISNTLISTVFFLQALIENSVNFVTTTYVVRVLAKKFAQK